MARPRLSEDTRLKLLQAGVDGFIQQGYHGTGIKEVLDSVGVPKGSFYNYFSSKEEFGAAVIRFYSRCFSEMLEDALAGKSDLASLRRFFRRLMKNFEAAGYVGGCLVANLGGELEGSEVCREALAESWRSWRNVIRDVLEACQQRGEVRSDLKAEEMADMLVDAWEGAVIRMKIERSLKPLRRCIDRMLGDFFLP